MKIKRRAFLKRSAMGMGGLLMAGRASGQEIPLRHFDPYEMVSLGKSGLKSSRICLGTGMKGGNRESNQTRLERGRFEQLLRGAYDRGVRTFDLADLYGSHPYILPALKGIPREEFRIITKIWFRRGGLPEPERPDADVVVRRFLREMGTDYMDLLLLHCMTAGDWPDQMKKQMDILADFKDQGTIRALGVSCHSLEALERAAVEPWVQSVHSRINPYGMSMDGPPDQVMPVLKRIHGAGKGVVGMKIVGEGRLRNDPEKRAESVKFALQSGCVDVLNVGCESLAELDDLASAVRGVAVV